ncbi:hypothetical protein Trydic_g17367 [Trypoxylus dichotomus]
MCMVLEAEKDGTQGSILLKAAVRACQSLKIPFDAAPASRKKEKPKQELKTLLKRAVCQHLKEEHLQKPMHGQYFELVSEQGLSPELSFSYLTSPTACFIRWRTRSVCWECRWGTPAVERAERMRKR